MPLSDVTIAITAGFRPGYLLSALIGIQNYLPECKVVVVNDDGIFPPTVNGCSVVLHKTIWKELPTDTFVTKKRNEAVKLVDTKYTLMVADDYDFTVDVRAAVIRMTEILDKYQQADVIAGTFNDRRYEGYLTTVKGEYIKETRLNEAINKPNHEGLYKVDIAAFWFLARTSTLRYVPWDETIGPIGGEHADWFLDLKDKGRLVLWTPGLNMYEQPKDLRMEHPEYRKMRWRCIQGHNLMLAKRGVKQYFGFDEEVK